MSAVSSRFAELPDEVEVQDDARLVEVKLLEKLVNVQEKRHTRYSCHYPLF